MPTNFVKSDEDLDFGACIMYLRLDTTNSIFIKCERLDLGVGEKIYEYFVMSCTRTITIDQMRKHKY
jgi:hypothetical protein